MTLKKINTCSFCLSVKKKKDKKRNRIPFFSQFPLESVSVPFFTISVFAKNRNGAVSRRNMRDYVLAQTVKSWRERKWKSCFNSELCFSVSSLLSCDFSNGQWDLFLVLIRNQNMCRSFLRPISEYYKGLSSVLRSFFSGTLNN